MITGNILLIVKMLSFKFVFKLKRKKMPIFKVVDYFGKNFAFIRDRKSDNLFCF
jgi:hypothetical protein